MGLFPVIALIYTLLARCDETRMLGEFGDEYHACRSHVPMFFPRAGPWRQLVGRSNSKRNDDE